MNAARTPLRVAPRLVAAGAITVLSVVAAVVLTIRHPDALVTFLPSTDMHELHVDFDTFWHSAVALTQGTDIYATPAKLKNLNPPILSLLLAPFAWLDSLTAYRIFASLTLLMVIGSIWAVARELRLRPLASMLAMLAVLLSSPLHGTLVLGQIYPMLLVGLVAGWIAERRGHPVLAGVLYGVTVALKPSLAPLVLLAAFQRRWVSLWAGIAGAVGATLVGVFAAGPSSAFEWLRIAFSEPVPDSVDNASLPGLAVRFGLPSEMGTALALLVLVGTLWWAGRHRHSIDPAGAMPWAVVAAGLLFSPIAWHNYLMLLFPGVLLLIALGRGAAATGALAVTVIPVSWNAEWPPQGFAADVARSLYCVILVSYWVLLMRAAAVPAGERTVEPGPVGDGAVVQADEPRPVAADPAVAGPHV